MTGSSPTTVSNRAPEQYDAICSHSPSRVVRGSHASSRVATRDSRRRPPFRLRWAHPVRHRRRPAPTGRRSSIDSPLVGALINVGDSVLVTVRLHDNKQLKNATILGVTEKGSTDLGTYTQTSRYKTVSIPASGGVPLRASRHDDPPLPAAGQRRRHVARQPAHHRHRDGFGGRRRYGHASHRHRRRPQGDRRRSDQRRQHSRRRRPQRLGACPASERRRSHRHSRPG